MTHRQVTARFEPHGRAVSVLPGTGVLEAAARAGMTIRTPCGGQGTCGKCRAQFTAGAPAPGAADRQHFSESELAEGWRLACRSRIDSDAVIAVPDTSLFAAGHQILTEPQKSAGEVMPAVRKIYVELGEPSLADDSPDMLRLERQTGPVRVDLDLLRILPGRLRECDFAGTAVLTDHHLIDFEPGDTTGRCFGLAFDIGTTTIVASLLDLCTGDELAVASAMNPQVSFGDDVLSRIQHGGRDVASLDQLRRAVLSAIEETAGRACAQGGIEPTSIYEVALAGNTTMQHLLAGLDVTQLGRVPFVPAHGRGLLLRAAELEIPIHPRGGAYIFPVIGGFVGGDTVAGMLAAGLDSADGPLLMVDIGTNGEIVLAHDGQLWAASTAAGPAFEGARISCGMRATTGAIEKVIVDGDVRIDVIGGGEPVGICGSGLIDAAAELLRAGLMSPQGRLLPPDELPGDLAPGLAGRIEAANGDVTFRLSGADENDVRLTQRDLRELQLATAAIRAGTNILLGQAGLGADELRRVLVAGGFGSFIRRSGAQAIGLLPPKMPHDRISYIGNASLNGARWALLSTNARRRGEELARRTKHVELSQDTNFQMEFAEALIFPGRKPPSRPSG